MTDEQKIDSLLRHMKRVEDNCLYLAKKLLSIDRDFALKLIIRGRNHDLTKFSKFQFENLHSGSPKLADAIDLHRRSERHHPEFYGEMGINAMTDLDIAEMVCDCLARSQEFGTNIRDWFFKEEYAPTIYNYKGNEVFIKKIDNYLQLLLTPVFTYSKSPSAVKHTN